MGVQQGLELLYPYFYGKAVNLLSQKSDWDRYVLLFTAMFFVPVISKAIGHVRDMLIEQPYIDYGVPLSARERTLAHLLGLSLGVHRSRNSALTSTIIDSGESNMSVVINDLLYKFLPCVVGLVLTITIMLAINWELGLVALLGAFLYTFVVFLVNSRYRKAKQEVKAMENQVQKFYSEILRWMTLVKMFGREKGTLRELMDKTKNVYGCSRKIKRSQRVRYRSAIVIIHGAILLIFYIAGREVFSGTMSAGGIVMFVTWAHSVLDSFQNLSELGTEWAEIMPSLTTYFEILDIRESRQEKGVPGDVIWGDIVFSDVSFRYPGPEQTEEEGKEVLRGVSFTAKEGETIALVGKSGSGKTTLFNLLIGAYDPQGGDILIGEHSLRSVKQESLLSRLGYVPQETQLFDNTIAYNLGFAREGVTEAEMWEVLERVELSSSVRDLPFGLYTRMGEAGVRFSGGQKQRLALARALIRKPKLLLLDEVASNLDTVTRRAVNRAIEHYVRGEGATIITIVHQLSTIRRGNRIIVMDKGRVEAIGAHDELLLSSPTYRELYEEEVALI